MEDVGEDQVIDVAAVAGNQHHRVLLHAIDHLLEADDLEAREQLRPDAVEEELEDPEVEAVEVGGHLVEVAARFLPYPPPRHAAFGPQPPDEKLELRVAEHPIAHDAPGEQGRPPHDALLAVEEYLERARQAADDPLLALAPVLLDEPAERDFPAERQLRLLGVPEIGEEALRLTGRLLDAVEQRREARLLAAKPLAAEDGHRHQEHGPDVRLRRAHDVVEVLWPEPRRRQRPPPSPRHRLTPHEEQHGLTCSDQARTSRMRRGAGPLAEAERPTQQVAEGPEAHRRHPRREARERQTLA